MAIDRPTLSPNALTSLDAARDYLKRGKYEQKDDDDALTLCINAASATLNRATGRRLRCQNYRRTGTVTGTWTAGTTGTQSITNSTTSALKVLDDVVGLGLGVGSRIQSITSGSAFVLDRNATADGAGVTLTYGSGALTSPGARPSWDQDERRILQIPQRPVEAVWTVYYFDGTGAIQTLDLTGAILDHWTGSLRLVNDSLPVWFEVLIECQAGFRPRSATDLGLFPDDFDALQGACHRLVQVMWQDQQQAMGRGVTVSSGSATFSTSDFKMPADVQAVIDRYRAL